MHGKECALTSEAYYTLALAHMKEDRLSEAIKAFEKSIAALRKADPPEHWLKVKLGYANCLRTAGDFPAALSAFAEIESLCVQHDLDPTVAFRQWAITHELNGDFKRARAIYEQVTPDVDTPADDRLKWHHAVGLLEWRDGNLTDAQRHLTIAADQMPADPAAASKLLAVLGNAALLLLEIGETAAAKTRIGQIFEIMEGGFDIPFSSRINFFRLTAALAKADGDHSKEAETFAQAIAFIDAQREVNWMYRLDMLNEYAEALVRAGQEQAAIDALRDGSENAPTQWDWMTRITLARLLIEQGEGQAARDNLVRVIVSFVGAGAPESEVSIVMEIARLAALENRPAAAVFLGKLAVRYLTDIAHACERDQQVEILEAGSGMTRMTVDHLHQAGRFEEALILQNLFDHLRRNTLLLKRAPEQWAGVGTVPFTPAERAILARWEADRQRLADLRKGEDGEAAAKVASEVISALFALGAPKVVSRLSRLAAPKQGALRLSLVISQDACMAHYRGPDQTIVHALSMSGETLLETVAALRTASVSHDTWQEPAAKLYHALIAPIADQLDHITCLEIDATSALRRIPFALLSDGTQCLIEKVAIRYVIDASPGPQGGPPRQGIAHFSGFSGGPLARLRERIGGAAQQSFVTGKAFSRAGLLQALSAHPEHLSMVAHLEYMPTRPDLSAIWLGSDEPLYLSDFAGERFDLAGMGLALFAGCSTSLEDATETGETSLAALALDKGVQCVVATIWDITESAAAHVVEAFWRVYQEDPGQDPAHVLARVQRQHAVGAHRVAPVGTASGGIGNPAGGIPPVDWAGFAVFENGNS